MTAVITFAILILVIRGVPVLFNFCVAYFRKLLAKVRVRRSLARSDIDLVPPIAPPHSDLKALPPPRDTD